MISGATVHLYGHAVETVQFLCREHQLPAAFEGAGDRVVPLERYTGTLRALRALDPATVQRQLDRHLGRGGDWGLEMQMDLGLPLGPLPSPLRVHDRGCSVWTEIRDFEIYELVWCWAADEQAARNALQVEIGIEPGDEFWQGMQDQMRVHPGLLLPQALNPRRLPESRLFPAWQRAYQQAVTAGEKDDHPVTVRLS